MKTKVILLARAYNDIDCRLPLLLEFARDPRYEAEVIGVPSNNGIQDPRKHELSGLLSEKNVRISTVYDRAAGAPLLGAAYKLYMALQPWLDRAPFGEKLKRSLFRLVFRLSVRNTAWIGSIIAGFRSSILLMDEIAFQRGRSFFIDEVVKARDTGGYRIYSFVTGQDPYLNLWHDKGHDDTVWSKERVGIPLLVPGPNDRDIARKRIPADDIEVVGNTRFDLPWVERLSGFSAANIRKNSVLSEPLGHKVVFMLSKIEYGVDLENIVEAMNVCAAVKDCRVIVKPHTRGMSIDELQGKLDKRVINGARMPSSDLMEWADTVFFTGSSIVFQAMQLRRKVIFLKYCQRYKSLFDETDALLIAHSKDDVVRFVESNGDGDVATGPVEVFFLEHVYNGAEAGQVCRAIKERIERTQRAEAVVS
jgi:hypothetical protein